MKYSEKVIPNRKIIQICVTPDKDIYALCDDGSLWKYVYGWTRVNTTVIENAE